MINLEKEDIKFNLNYLLALVMTDIDIFLLQNEAQTKDNDKLYTKEEVREQLKKTLEKMIEVLAELNVNVDKPLATHATMLGRDFFNKKEWGEIRKKVML